MKKKMKPSEIRFTQDTIAQQFGHDSSKTIENTFRGLLYKTATLNLIPPIQVSQAEGVYWAMSCNRRLYVYQALEKYRQVEDILVEVIPLDSEKVSH